MISRFLVTLILFMPLTFARGQAPLSTGRWYRIEVDKPGVYRINFDQMKKMGFDPGKTDPRNIRIFGMEGGMLPQLNSAPRPDGLTELAIEVKGESDGVFNKEDIILFYAEGADRVAFNAPKKAFLLERNLYSDFNYYFITVSSDRGKRITTRENGTGASRTIDSFQDYFFHEKDEHNELKSGREWYGERFELTTDQSFTFDVAGIVGPEPLMFVSDVMAQSLNPSSFRIEYNGNTIGEQPIATIPNTTYGVKGRTKRDTVIVTASVISADAQARQTIRYAFTRGSSGRSIGFLNFFSAHFTRRLALYGDQTRFRSAESRNETCTFVIGSINQQCELWDITDPYTPVKQQYVLEGNQGRFVAASGTKPNEFVVFNTRYLSPRLVANVPNQNLRGLSTPDYVIVTHPSFASEAERLAAHRSSRNGWESVVVNVQEVYNEFSSGRQDITAIRDFARHLYNKSPGKLKALLLFGKCSYDYKDRITNNTNFVPTYESRNSLSPLETYSSDDYFGFLESGEGEWGETNFMQSHTLDIGIGRLPIKSLAEGRAVVDKLIEYDIGDRRFGPWRKDIVFVADDGSNSDGFTSIHQSQANALAEAIEWQRPELHTRKLFLGTYQKNVSPNGESIPKANEDIVREFNQAVIINYTGHGSEQLWADERVLNRESLEKLDNKRHPFLVTATCEFGRHDNPAEISGAEASVLKAKAGSIGLVTTARPVNSSTNFALNAAFYDALLASNSTIGEVFRATKNNSMSGVANRNFSLLGDPAMRLALPSQNILVDQISTSQGSDTLKALSNVRVVGRVLNEQGSTDGTFQGILDATLFDKRTRFVTIGRNDPPFSFEQWFNPLFRGKATVKDGIFEVEFIIPRNIAYEINPGKLSLYASSSDSNRDAFGSSTAFKVGGSEPDPSNDSIAPEMDVFLGDTTFVDGGTVSPETDLVVRIHDASGINISNYGIGNTMMAVLDHDDKVFLLNEYYVADADDFTKGWVNYRLKGLSQGPHTLTVKVWDTYNNPAEKTIRFVVSAEGALVINSFVSFPNPVITTTTFSFAHNRPGDHLRGLLSILSMAGREIHLFELDLPASSYEVQIPFDSEPGKNLAPGVYFARLRLRSLSDGAGSERVIKVIVAN